MKTKAFCESHYFEIFRQDLLCHDEIGGLLWVAISDASGTPNLDENALEHSDLRFCGRTNYDRKPGTLLRGDIDGKVLK